MKLFIQLGAENRVVQVGKTKSTDNDIEIDIPQNHELHKNPFIFKYEQGQLVSDETFRQQVLKEKEEQDKKLPPEKEIELLKKQNADLAFELMMKGLL